MKISEMITDRYKLRIPPTVYYDLLADVQEAEEEQEPCEDVISRKSIKQKLQEHHDFFVNAYGGFSNLPQNDKSRVDEITNCIAMVVNEPPVTPQEPRKGHWIPTYGNVKCSVCGSVKDSRNVGRATHYCEFCGAKMVEREG